MNTSNSVSRGTRDVTLHLDWEVERGNLHANINGSEISSVRCIELPAGPHHKGDLEAAALLMLAGDWAGKVIQNLELKATLLTLIEERLRHE